MRSDAVRRLGLRGRLVSLFLIALIPVIATEVFSVIQQRNAVRADASRDVTRLAHLVAAQLEGALGSTYGVLRLLGGHPEVAAGGAVCEAVLDQMLAASTAYSGVAARDAKGQLLCSSPRTTKIASRRRPAFERLFKKSDFSVSQTVIGALSGKPVVLAAHAVRRDSQLTGAIIIGLDLARLTELAARIELPHDASFFIVGSEGTVLVKYPDPASWVGRSATTAPIYRDILKSPTTSRAIETTGLDGTEQLFGYAPLEAGGDRFFVVVGLDINQLSAPANRILRGNLSAVAFAALLAFATATLAGESFLRRPIRRMLNTAGRIASGDFTARVDLDSGPGELGELARGIDHMAAGIQAREERLAALSRRILDVQESERRALARELHDEIGQALTALKLMLQGLGQCDVPQQNQKTSEMIGIVERTLQQVRSLSLDLRPPMLDHLGLPATLRWYVDREAERAGLAVTCRVHPADVRLDARLETTIFRIAQEALTNVTRHAAATTVAVTLMVVNNQVELIIRDDGGGFDVDAARDRASGGVSLGISGMEERATLAGGRLDIRSGPFGTEVRGTFPYLAERPGA